MSKKVVFLVLLGAVASAASAQNINFGFPDAGDRQVWISPSKLGQAPTDSDGIRTGKSEATLPIGSMKDDALVYVWDRKTGNLAFKTVKDVKVGTWELKPEDFKTIGQLAIHVEHSGKPVAAATVDLDDGAQKRTQLLDPSSKGTVNFFDVKPGSEKVTVHYKVSGKDMSPVTQLMEIAISHPEPSPTVTVSLAEAVETVGAASTPDASASGSPATKPGSKSTDPGSEASSSGDDKSDKGSGKDSGGGNFFGKLIVYVIALGGMVAAVYYAMQYMKNNPDSVAAQLEQLGAQIPKPGDDPLTNPSQMPAPVKPTPAPVQKIILDDAAPTPLGSTGSVAPTPIYSSIPSEPRLVGQSGDAMPLPEGDLTVGREVGLGLSLVGESSVSRKHAQISRNGSQVTVIDCGSTNGTFVNGVQLQGEKLLQNGDTVQFGSVRFRYEG